MYYPYFIAYIMIGLILSLVVFFWALKTGQFKDQQRARFLPLRDNDVNTQIRVSRMGRLETYSLFALAAAGLAASAAIVVFSLSAQV
jgi:cbb3-type cytochrome oxidase maturation protein